MIEAYLCGRSTLKGVVIIMDIRRIPGKEESDLLGWLDHYSIAGILVLTKTDKLSKSKQVQQHDRIARALELDKENFILFSAKSRRGKDALWTAILSLAGIEGPRAIG
jgi:GTP-binding protein